MFARTKRVPEYTVRVIYKSGAEIEFRCLTFTYNVSTATYEWTVSPSSPARPILLGASEIAAVWQVGTSEVDVPVNPNEGAQP